MPVLAKRTYDSERLVWLEILEPQVGRIKHPTFCSNLSPFDGGPTREGTRRSDSNGFWFSIGGKNSDSSILQLAQADDVRIGARSSRLVLCFYTPVTLEP